MTAGLTVAVETLTRASRAGAVIAALLVVAAISMPAWAESSTMRLLVELICYLVLAQMWNLLAGFSGLISIGQQAFLGIGGYTLFALANHAGVNPFAAILIGGVVAALLAVPTGALLFRLRQGYFAVGTWVVAEVYRLLIANASVLGGGSGQSLTAMSGIPREVREPVTLWIAVVMVVGTFALVYKLLRSRLGLALTAIRDDEIAAASQGVDVSRVKFGVYVLSASGSGLVGALYYLNGLRIAPNAAFDVGWTAAVIFIVVIGGIGTLEGPILGTLIFFGLRELLADYGSVYLIVLGSLAVLVMMKWPRGIWGFVQERFDLRLFPVQRRVHGLESDSVEDRRAPRLNSHHAARVARTEDSPARSD